MSACKTLLGSGALLTCGFRPECLKTFLAGIPLLHFNAEWNGESRNVRRSGSQTSRNAPISPAHPLCWPMVHQNACTYRLSPVGVPWKFQCGGGYQSKAQTNKRRWRKRRTRWIMVCGGGGEVRPLIEGHLAFRNNNQGKTTH
jgi:hypothetical protein